MRKIKIAQIGINKYSHGEPIFDTLTQFPEVFDIAGYTLVENEREECAHLLGVFSGYPELTLEEILEDKSIEAVVIETDEVHLTKYAILACRYGKHIHMEKPGSQSLEDFEELIRAVKLSGKVFHTGYMYRYNPYIVELVERVRRGELGEIHSIEAQMDCIQTDKAREWLGTFRGGMMFYLGCHLIDIALTLMGEPESVSVFNKSTGISGIISEDYAMAVLGYKNGTAIVKSDAAELGGYARRQIVVTGSKGTVELKPLEMRVPGKRIYDLYTDKTEYISRDWSDMGESSRREFHRYADMLLAFARMVRGEIENPYTPDYELKLFKLILKCCGM